VDGKVMQFLIIGSGAIGGSAGAYLVMAGYDVLFIDTELEHVRTMQTKGLTIEGRRNFTVQVRATTPDQMSTALGGRDPDAVILAVKSQHTDVALAPLLPLLGPQTFVLSVQNGLNPHAIARKIGAKRTLASLVNSMGTDYIGPGHIMYGGPGTMYLGELDGSLTPRLLRLARVMKDSFVENTHATSNIWGYLWGKEGFGAMLFAGAVMDVTIADLLADPLNFSLLADIAGEVVAVADAEGVRCEAFDGYEPDAMRFTPHRDWEAIQRSLSSLEQIYRRSLKQKSGIWRDLAVRHRITEVDAQLGIVSKLGRRHNIPVPLIDRVVNIIHEIERGSRKLDAANIQELRELDRLLYPNGVLTSARGTSE
jgi:2-dehydropantoate 2-reductase